MIVRHIGKSNMNTNQNRLIGSNLDSIKIARTTITVTIKYHQLVHYDKDQNALDAAN